MWIWSGDGKVEKTESNPGQAGLGAGEGQGTLQIALEPICQEKDFWLLFLFPQVIEEVAREIDARLLVLPCEY